jgi:dienelactone hydrolase
MRRVCLGAGLCCLVLALAGCPSKFNLGFPGELPVARVFVDDLDGIDPISIYYPDTDPPMENLPVVILDTGFNQPRLAYEGYGQQLAQWGFVCVVKFVASPGLTGIGDARVDDHVVQNSALLDWLAVQNVMPESALYGMLDTENAGIIGHSLGAGIAIDTTVSEPRIQAAVSLDGNYPGPEFDPRDALPEEDAAILFFFATEGRWCSGQRFDQPRLFEFTSPDAIEVSIIGASHLDFMDSIIGLTHVAPFVCPRGSQDAQVVRDIATRYLIAWFNVYLKGMDEFQDYYNGDKSVEDESAGLVSIRYNLAE